jgi:ABC-type lipoprotein export system ATPase subunit
MEIKNLTILGGVGKDGRAEGVQRVDLRMGQVVSIVGPTGCGKTTLINDIELFANRNTPSQRRVLINGRPPADDLTMDPSRNPVALISQHTNFLSDLPVHVFLETHAKIRRSAGTDTVVQETLDFANQLTGEPLNPASAMTELSGGQTRALLIADAVVIGQSPIILLDEIENAGIHRTRALELLRRYEKMFLFVTHDPRIALLSDFRIVLRTGGMQEVIETNDEEQKVADEIRKLDDLLLEFRQKIRQGERLGYGMLEERLRALGYLA